MSTESSELFSLFNHVIHETRHVNHELKDSTLPKHKHPNPGQLRVIFLLAKHEHMSNSEIVEALKIRPSSATGLVNRLVKGDLVKRDPSPTDKRIMLISLTDRGQRFLDSAHQLRDQLSETIFEALSPDEQKQLAVLLKKLSADMEEKLPKWIKSQAVQDFFDSHEEFREDMEHFGFFQSHDLPKQ